MAHDLAYFEDRKRELRQRDRSGMFFVSPEETRWFDALRGGAGSYTDAPNRRVAWDDDGSLLLWLGNGQPMVERDATVREIVNNETNAAAAVSVDNVVGDIIIIFPELREFNGFFFSKIGTPATYGALDTSTDTTNGVDGTWVERDANFPDPILVTPDVWRTSITSHAVSNVRGIRMHKTGTNNGDDFSVRAIHIYGEISASETPDRLLWIDNDDDLEFSKPQDYGDVPRGSASDHVVYLTNNSASLAANTVLVTAEDFHLGAAAWYTFDDGTGFAATKTLASSIAATADSPDITIRRIIPDAEVLGLHEARAYVNVGSWT